MDQINKCCGIILAAGKGTRMNSPYPKVLAELDGKPLIDWVVENVSNAGISPLVIVVGYQADLVRETLKRFSIDILFANQEEQLGTGHAVAAGISEVPVGTKTVVATYGDMPFIASETFASLVKKRCETSAAVVLTTVFFDEPMGPAFGRVKRDAKGKIQKIVEQKVCTEEELKIKECNAGPVAYDAEWLKKALPKLKKSPVGEYYLTDLAEIAYDEGLLVESVSISCEDEAHGINTVDHLEEAHKIISKVG